MQDKFGREINYLRLSITDRCNLHCSYCRPKEGVAPKSHDEILRYEEIIRIVSEAAKIGFVKVRVTGGEPLVRRGFVGLLHELNKIAGLQDLSLTTNGILLEEYAADIFDAGVRRLNISLDSLQKEKYAGITNGGDLDLVLRGIARAGNIGFSPIKINMVVIKGLNDDEILNFAKLALDKPLQVRFIELMPFKQARIDHDRKYLPSLEVMQRITKCLDLDSVNITSNELSGPARVFKIKGGRGEIGFINPVSDGFCSSCNRLRLTADGKLRSCLLGDEEIDLKKVLRDSGSNDRELANLISDAILLKPLHHNLHSTITGAKECNQSMADIGG
jgi:cyclic pyranopterin phosphate synthase